MTWLNGLVRLLLLIAGDTIASMTIAVLRSQTGIQTLALADICTIVLTVITARPNVVLAIRLYQRYAPEHIRLRCAMTPTCSEYAVLAIRRHGILRGTLMTYRRLRHRCDGTPVTDYP